MSRVIALVDMNSYYASCHQAVTPELEGKEVIVAGDPERRTGIVLAASYPAKAKGVKTGMPHGLTILETVSDFRKVFYSKPVRKLFGIGPRYEMHLRNLNIFTIGDLANYPVEILQKRWGRNGELLWYWLKVSTTARLFPAL